MPASSGTCPPSSRGCTRAPPGITFKCFGSKSSSASTRSPTHWDRDWRSISSTPGRTPTASTWTWYETTVFAHEAFEVSFLLFLLGFCWVPAIRYHCCVVVVATKGKAIVLVNALGKWAFRETALGTYQSLSLSCRPHGKRNDSTNLVRAGGTCPNWAAVFLNVLLW